MQLKQLLNNYSLGLANNGAALKELLLRESNLWNFQKMFGIYLVNQQLKAMDKYMDDSLYVQIRESYETSLRGTTSY